MGGRGQVSRGEGEVRGGGVAVRGGESWEGLVQEGEGAAVDLIDQHLAPPSGPLVKGGGVPCLVVRIEVAQNQCVIWAGEKGSEGTIEGVAGGAARDGGDVDAVDVER